jgi:hypothetical protein
MENPPVLPEDFLKTVVLAAAFLQHGFNLD